MNVGRVTFTQKYELYLSRYHRNIITFEATCLTSYCRTIDDTALES